MSQLLDGFRESRRAFIAISDKSQLTVCGRVLAPHRQRGNALIQEEDSPLDELGACCDNSLSD